MVAILVEEKADIAAFANYTGTASAPQINNAQPQAQSQPQLQAQAQTQKQNNTTGKK